MVTGCNIKEHIVRETLEIKMNEDKDELVGKLDGQVVITSLLSRGVWKISSMVFPHNFSDTYYTKRLLRFQVSFIEKVERLNSK